MFQKGKQKIAALFSSNPKPIRPSDHLNPRNTIADSLDTPNTSANNNPNSLERERASLTPVLGQKSKFWLSEGPPSQKSKDKAKRKMLRCMSMRSREKRTVTAANQRKMLKLENEKIDVRDFQREHDKAKRKEKKKGKQLKAEGSAKAVAIAK